MTKKWPIYRFGEHELDTALCEVRHAGNRIRIQPRVFDLIRYLIEVRDRVVTKEELFSNVWLDTRVSDAALASAIRDARRALGDSGSSQQIISTVSRRGFRFVAQVRESAPPADRALGDGHPPGFA